MYSKGLPESDPAAVQIRAAAARDTLSHALLFTGPGPRLLAAYYAAAALECENTGNRPCGTCQACRKVQEKIHPDVVTVQDEQHKTLSVDVIRAIRADAYIAPNEGRRKIYIFPDCSVLTERDQNVLLKIVEEGPPYAAFLFCAENASTVLQTLRSRCVEIKLHPLEENYEEELPEAGEALCRAVTSRRRGAAVEWAVRLEKQRMDRESLRVMLAKAREVFAAALLLQYGGTVSEGMEKTAAIVAKTLTKAQIMTTIELLERYYKACAYNVGSGHVLGALAAELEGTL